MSAPFSYPPTPHKRRHGPKGYADYQSYRPWLRDEFSFRCVYCLLREQWSQIRGGHGIDHFQSIALQPLKQCDYDNLLVACLPCNALKSKRIIGDPTKLLTAPNVWVTDDGAIHTDNPEAARLIEALGLDSPQATELRALWIDIIALAADHDEPLYQQLMGFPDDLPNLAKLRPPGGNSRPEGVGNSYFAAREQGRLSET
jgi:hypothetical protein